MIYLDYVATTPLRPEVLSTYNNLLEKYFLMLIQCMIKELRLIV